MESLSSELSPRLVQRVVKCLTFRSRRKGVYEGYDVQQPYALRTQPVCLCIRTRSIQSAGPVGVRKHPPPVLDQAAFHDIMSALLDCQVRVSTVKTPPG